MKHVIAIYPGSFDPLTYGHLDLIDRGSRLFDEVIVAILRNEDKGAPLFSVAERIEMIQAMIGRWDNVRVDTFEGLLVDFARRVGARAVLRGIRAISDYEFELQMALMNRKLEPTLETVFLPAAESYSYLSSRTVKNLARLGGPVHGMVPDLVEERLLLKLKGKVATPQQAQTGGLPGSETGLRRTTGRKITEAQGHRGTEKSRSFAALRMTIHCCAQDDNSCFSVSRCRCGRCFLIRFKSSISKQSPITDGDFHGITIAILPTY